MSQTSTELDDSAGANGPELAATADSAAAIISGLGDAAWALAAVAHLRANGTLDNPTVTPVSEQDTAAAEVLESIGLLRRSGDGFAPTSGMAELLATSPPASGYADITSLLRKVAAVAA